MFEIIYRFDPTNLNTYKSPDTADEARRQLEAGNRQFAELTDPILGQVKSAPFVIESDSRAFAGIPPLAKLPDRRPSRRFWHVPTPGFPPNSYLEAGAMNCSSCASPAIY